MSSMRYPCRRCKRVETPGICENKNCAVWRLWFVQKWDRTRKLFDEVRS